MDAFQRLIGEKQVGDGGQQRLAFSDEEKQLAMRIKEVVGEESNASFGRRCGVNEGTLRKYLAGAQPSALRLVAIADAGGVNIAWLATGKGPKKGVELPPEPPRSDVDLARLQAAIGACEEGLRSIGRTLPPDKYAELVTAAYNLMGTPATTRTGVVQFIRAAA